MYIYTRCLYIPDWQTKPIFDSFVKYKIITRFVFINTVFESTIAGIVKKIKSWLLGPVYRLKTQAPDVKI